MIIDIQPDGLILFVAENDADWRDITDRLEGKALELGRLGVLTELRDAPRQLLIMIDPLGSGRKDEG